MKRLALRCLLAAALGAAGLAPALAADTPADPVVQDSATRRIDEPGLDLDRARAQLGRARPGLAAADVRRAAALLGDEAQHARGADKGRLRRDANALSRVAGEIDAGTIKQPRRFDLAVVAVHADLGFHHDLQATSAWARQDTEGAGRSLAAAARDVRRAFLALDARAARRTVRGLQRVEGFGAHLAHRTGSSVESEWTRARDTVQAALDDLSTRLGRPHAG
jgi:hypothetical protein